MSYTFSCIINFAIMIVDHAWSTVIFVVCRGLCLNYRGLCLDENGFHSDYNGFFWIIVDFAPIIMYCFVWILVHSAWIIVDFASIIMICSLDCEQLQRLFFPHNPNAFPMWEATPFVIHRKSVQECKHSGLPRFRKHIKRAPHHFFRSPGSCATCLS